MTDASITEIQERLNKATPGPWDAVVGKGDNWVAGRLTDVGSDDFGYFRVNMDRGTAEFVAHSRTDIPFLLSRITELEKRIHAAFEHMDDSDPDDWREAMHRILEGGVS